MIILSSALFYFFLSLFVCLRFNREIAINKLIVYFFQVTIVINVLVVEILDILHSLDQIWLFLLLQAIICILSAIILIDPQRKVFAEQLSKFRIKKYKFNGIDLVLVAVIVLILAGYFWVGLISPINNSDSLHTHLPRIYYWIQHGSMVSWDSITTTQITYPINLPIQGVWLFLLGNNEKLFFLIQWFSLLCVTLLVYEIARLLGTTKRQGLVASLVLLSYPGTLLQTFSLQGDVFITALLCCCVYSMLNFAIKKELRNLYLSAISLAVALGSKQTAFLFLPVYLLAILLILWRNKHRWKIGTKLAAIFFVSFAVLSSYKFIQNGLEKPGQNSGMFSTSRYSVPFTEGTSFNRYATNTMRYLYQWVSLDGFNGQLKLDSLRIKNEIFRDLSATMGLDLEGHEYISYGDTDYFVYDDLPILNEDAAWFGVLSWILIPAAVIVGLTKKDKVVRSYAIGSTILLLIYFFSTSILITGWSPTNGRYMIIPVVLTSPLIAYLIPKKQVWGNLTMGAITLVSVYLSISTLTMNESRPIITTSTLNHFYNARIESIPKTSKIARLYRAISYKVVTDLMLTTPNRSSIEGSSYYEGLFFQNSSEVRNIDFVNAEIPANESIYLKIEKTVLEYALFGINRTRELYPVQNLDQVPSGAYILVSNSLMTDTDTSGTKLQVMNDAYSILIKQ